MCIWYQRTIGHTDKLSTNIPNIHAGTKIQRTNRLPATRDAVFHETFRTQTKLNILHIYRSNCKFKCKSNIRCGPKTQKEICCTNDFPVFVAVHRTPVGLYPYATSINIRGFKENSRKLLLKVVSMLFMARNSGSVQWIRSHLQNASEPHSRSS